MQYAAPRARRADSARRRANAERFSPRLQRDNSAGMLAPRLGGRGGGTPRPTLERGLHWRPIAPRVCALETLERRAAAWLWDADPRNDTGARLTFTARIAAPREHAVANLVARRRAGAAPDAAAMRYPPPLAPARFPPPPSVVDAGALRPVPIALDSYLGAWFERMRLPAPFEAGLTHCTAEYVASPDGTLRVTNQGWRAVAGAWVTNVGVAVASDARGVLAVSFGGPFGPYVVLAAARRLGAPGAAAYAAAIVGSPSHAMLWVLTRTRDAPVDAGWVRAVAAANGYPESAMRRLERVPQSVPANSAQLVAARGAHISA